MKPSLRFIFSASTMLLVLFGLGACSGLNIWPVNAPPQEQIHRVVIDDNDKMCISAQDCVLVWTDCSACECGTPINQQHAAKVKEAYEAMCTNYRGPVCDMACPEVELDCIENLCVAIEKGK